MILIRTYNNKLYIPVASAQQDENCTTTILKTIGTGNKTSDLKSKKYHLNLLNLKLIF